MKKSWLLAGLFLFTLGGSACVETTTYSRTWDAPMGGPTWVRPGQVAWIREVVRRQDGNPAGGALAGALIGGALGHDGPGVIIGALGGAAIGAAVSQGSAEERHYEVMVHFDDGHIQMFVFGAYPPFQPGNRVLLTPNGLVPG